MGVGMGHETENYTDKLQGYGTGKEVREIVQEVLFSFAGSLV
jgi:hypothetical protein